LYSEIAPIIIVDGTDWGSSEIAGATRRRNIGSMVWAGHALAVAINLTKLV
jgi:hypothetical protein